MNLLNKLIDIIYPPRCPICNEFLLENIHESGAVSICRTCASDFREIISPLCPVCGVPFTHDMEEDHLCGECLEKRPLYETLRAPYYYEGAIMEAIHRFKYGEIRYLADYLGPLLAEFAENRVNRPDSFLIIPVPLHPKRLRERGFNQSLLLARHVSGQLKTELDFLSLRRVRYTQPQTTLAKDARRKNVKGAFQLKDPGLVKGRKVLLVDDVATTGNTLNECTRVLERAGCKKVFCLALARTGRL
ncbi:MAG: ComF family protein [Desulfobacterales bacterium]|nr:ComF family protein [Desulfobacterales bacterium]